MNISTFKSHLNYVLTRICTSLHYRIIFAPGVDVLYRFYQEVKIRQIRKKTQIKVLFIVGEASTWKSEALYRRMLDHPRFIPQIGITESLHVPGSKPILISYLQNKGYDYVDLDEPEITISQIDPDIKIYYKPYELNYRHGLYFDYHMKSIVCNFSYAFNLGGDAMAFRQDIRRYAWKDFVENNAVVEAIAHAGKFIGNKIITGLPLQDILSLPKESYRDPWEGGCGKKRIIYAPHHSFKGTNNGYIEYATFLEFGLFMLKMAKKYSAQTQWIFKPHPSLRRRLYDFWGEAKTNAYYDEWESLANAQVELGAYNDIFKYSDAMIHDCSSFIIEYQYTNNPVLFLETEPHTAEQMHLSRFGYAAYTVHYHASTKEQIENFIQNVIAGVDPRKEEREAFFEKYLRIPNGKTACVNIMDVILGEDNCQ